VIRNISIMPMRARTSTHDASRPAPSGGTRLCVCKMKRENLGKDFGHDHLAL
jgi:hypothetical protein